MEISNKLYTALCRYFNALSKLGYMKDTDVNKLLIFSYLEEVLNGKYIDTLTEEEYKSITECLNCLYGTTCLFDFPSYEVFITLPKNYITLGYRYTEGIILRESEDTKPRSI